MSHREQPRHHVALGSTGITHRLTIDGTDVSRAIRSCTLHLASGEQPMLLLDPCVVALDTTEADGVRVLVNKATVDLLVGLGWTPPEDQTL
ncbi:hypothetical protein ACIGZJ_31205 [Kitasatospora sp. NPDC052868]|uniref:hypothetical protein n=1 Tax=Kitasatospora sp. NPDC052868 TaxID=3364060 RepID=UPI0037C6CDDD